jgi:hypothetical protein
MPQLIHIGPAEGKHLLNIVKRKSRIENMFRGQVLMVPNPGFMISGVYYGLHMA